MRKDFRMERELAYLCE
jgi:hypothetical protein